MEGHVSKGRNFFLKIPWRPRATWLSRKGARGRCHFSSDFGIPTGRGFGGDELYSPSCQRLTRARPLLAPAAFHPDRAPCRALVKHRRRTLAPPLLLLLAQGKLDLPLLSSSTFVTHAPLPLRTCVSSDVYCSPTRKRGSRKFSRLLLAKKRRIIGRTVR